MRVFVTGATGFVGSAVVKELMDAGYEVLGLARSEEGAAKVRAAGAEVQRGELEDLESLRAGAAKADAVIHTAFIHDFSRYPEVAAVDERAIAALGEALAGSDRALIVTSGLLLAGKGGGLPTEEDAPPSESPRKSEQAAEALAKGGIRASVVRLPPSVHGDGDHGFVPMLAGIARQKGVSAYIDEGRNRWAGVHRLDAARLYRLVLEKGEKGGRYHAIGDEGVPFREIAAAIGRQLGVPVVSKSGAEAEEHFGWMSRFAGLEIAASGERTRQALGWAPKERGLLADIDRADYFESAKTVAGR